KTGTSATGTTGTVGTSESIPSTLHLMASGNSSANWSRYLNHKVEVKGTLEHSMGGSESYPTGNPPSSTTPPSTNPSNPPSTNPTATEPSRTGGTMTGSDMGSTFRVASIKEVSGTCSVSSK